MTDGEQAGAAIERRHRRRYWTLLLGGLVVAVVLGSVGRAFKDPAGAIDPMVASVVAAGVIVLMVAGTWAYYRSVDELEWANNLAACFWGFNAFLLAYPTWHILWKGGLVPEPDATAIYLGSAFVAVAAYLWKRFR